MTPKQVKEFAENKEADFAIGVPGIGRFRVNVYQQRGTIAYALRAVPYQVKTITELNLPAGGRADRDEAARPGARHRRHGFGQVDGARRDDPAHQREAAREHHHDRGPDRVPAPRHQLVDQPARSGRRHRILLGRAAARAAAGPRRHPDRRDPRPRDARDRAQGRRHGPPGVLDAAHHRRDADDQPRDLLLRAAPAGRGAVHALEGAVRRHLAAPRAARRRQGTRARRARSSSTPRRCATTSATCRSRSTSPT